ncbi:hypothetical protein KBW71_00530 [Hydrogenophaga aromaticivorans]|uniref:hypothetical protein n=1 Tax=Hydrogenophaga aromaticivorans TaxID=2610898 RepID=UPI001B3654AE|nr:hypothetical protein [Hydrogenophaga aromaticivorans]MBQ0916936.1 hypothetical protein [Hydrogenophaga aromaticivorans]
MPSHHYTIDAGDGRWLLNQGGQTITSTTGDRLAFAYDKECGTLHKHGDPVRVQAWVNNAKAKLQGFPELAGALDTLEVASLLPCQRPKDDVLYITAEEANRCLSTSGYILTLLSKLHAIEVDAIQVHEGPTA